MAALVAGHLAEPTNHQLATVASVAPPGGRGRGSFPLLWVYVQKVV